MTASWWSSAAFVGAACLCSCQLVSGLNDLEATAGAGGAAAASVSAASATTSGSGGAGGAGGAVTCMGDICVEEFVANTFVEVRFLAIDFGSLYWSGQGTASQGSAIYRKPLLGGGEEPITVTFEAKPLGLAVDPYDKLVFWPEAALATPEIRYALADDVSQTGMTSHLGTTDPMAEWYGLIFGTSSNFLFWVSRASTVLYRGTSESIGANYAPVSGGSSRTRALATDDVYVYFIGMEGLTRSDPNGNDVTPITSAAGDTTAGLAVDGEYVYWTNRDAAGSVNGAPKTMKDAPVTAISSEVFASSIAQDGQSLYWATDGADDCHTGLGMIRRTKLGLVPDKIETLATPQVCPTNFVVGEEHVYWGSGTKIYRVAK